MIRVSKLLKKEKTEKYRKLMEEQWRVEWRVVRVRAVMGVEEVWEMFKAAILKTSEEVCGLRTVGAGVTKSEWLSEETDVAVREKADVFAKYMVTEKDRCSREEYKRKIREVKRVIAD
jgi:hypothetical protein